MFYTASERERERYIEIDIYIYIERDSERDSDRESERELLKCTNIGYRIVIPYAHIRKIHTYIDEYSTIYIHIYYDIYSKLLVVVVPYIYSVHNEVVHTF